MAILRGYNPERSVAIAERAWDVGVLAVEVPIQSAAAIESFQAVIEAGKCRGAVVGAGTVTTTEQVEVVHGSGGAFTVSPGFSQQVADASVRRGIAHLPGVATASDIQLALASGCRWLKAFPASVLGPEWIQAMRGPFPDIKFVATGGITLANATSFLAAGAKAVSLGAALTDPDALGRVEDLRRYGASGKEPSSDAE